MFFQCSECYTKNEILLDGKCYNCYNKFYNYKFQPLYEFKYCCPNCNGKFNEPYQHVQYFCPFCKYEMKGLNPYN